MTITPEDVLEFRSNETDFEFDDETRTVKAIAAPYNEIGVLPDGTQELIEPHALQIYPQGAVLKEAHLGIIGEITKAESRDQGLYYEAKFFDTPSGNEAYVNAKQKAYKGSSVGWFKNSVKKVKDATTGIVHITKGIIPEISLTSEPIYTGAAILDVRDKQTPQGDPMTITNEEIDAKLDNLKVDIDRNVQTRISELEKRSRPTKPEANPLEKHSAGSFLKTLATGNSEEATELVEAYQELIEKRDYDGATTSESVAKDQFVGDLTRLVYENATLIEAHEKGTLPSEGLQIDYAELDSETFSSTYGEHEEGDDLAYGEIDITLKQAPVKKYGGRTRLTIDVIERSTVDYLNHALRGMAIGTGKALNRAMRTNFLSLASAQITAGNVVEVDDLETYDTILGAAIDAGQALDDQGLALDQIVCNAEGFKLLQSIKATDGRPTLLVSGAGVNNIGNINVKGFSGDIAGIPIKVDLGLNYFGEDYNPEDSGTPTALPFIAFENRLAIRSRISPLVRLQDQNIINLSKDFSIYAWAAIANETPKALIPLQITG